MRSKTGSRTSGGTRRPAAISAEAGVADRPGEELRPASPPTRPPCRAGCRSRRRSGARCPVRLPHDLADRQLQQLGRVRAVDGEAKPSPMSVEPARALSRSGTCLRKSATTKPTAATGTVQRNTVCRVSAYASMIGAAAVGGQRVQALRALRGLGEVAGSAVPVTARPPRRRRRGWASGSWRRSCRRPRCRRRCRGCGRR